MAAISSPVTAWARMSCQIGAVLDGEVQIADSEQFNETRDSIGPPWDLINCRDGMKPGYESDGTAIASHTDSSCETGRGDREANPQTRTDEEMERSKMHGGI